MREHQGFESTIAWMQRWIGLKRQNKKQVNQKKHHHQQLQPNPPP